MKNSTDTIFELEILAQKMRAKIRINVQKLAQKCKNAQNNNKILQKCANLCKKLRAKPKNLHSWKKLAQMASPASPSFSLSAYGEEKPSLKQVVS